MKCIIVDDEFLARERLEKLITKVDPSIEICAKSKNGIEAIKDINTYKPDVVFLDIQMPEVDGFQVIENLEYKPLIVFVTAYNEYALEAFKVRAIRYLLKPIKKKDLIEVIDFVKDHLSISEATSSSNDHNKLAIKEAGRNILIPIDEIHTLLTINRIIFIYTNKAKYIADKAMDEYETILQTYGFFRSHRSYLININHVSSFKREQSGKYLVRMGSEIDIVVSREKVKEFQAKLSNVNQPLT